MEKPLDSTPALRTAGGPVLAAALGLGLSALPGACKPAEPGAPPPPRNLLLITIDTLRADHLGCYGYERDTSPALDAFAEQSVLFEAAHSVCSWTLPSVVSIMTSLYPSAHGCTADESALADDYVTLAELLAGQGFRTGAVTSHLYLSRRFKLDQGFEEFDEDLVWDSFKRSHEQISSPGVTDKGLAWLDEHAGSERWFLWLHYFDPHSKYQHHPREIEPFGDSKLDVYDGEIAFTDLHIGRLLEGLDRMGLRDSTVVALIADHGEAFREHGSVGHRRTLYQEELRVPLVIRAPGMLPGRVSTPTSCVDLLPTLLDLLQIAPPPALEGESLRPALEGRELQRGPILAEMRNVSGRDWDGLIDGRWKFLIDLARSRQLLFDLQADPDELTDLSESEPEVLRRMAARFEELRARSRARGESFGARAEIELTPGEVESLQQLGYMGDE